MRRLEKGCPLLSAGGRRLEKGYIPLLSAGVRRLERGKGEGVRRLVKGCPLLNTGVGG